MCKDGKWEKLSEKQEHYQAINLDHGVTDTWSLGGMWHPPDRQRQHSQEELGGLPPPPHPQPQLKHLHPRTTVHVILNSGLNTVLSLQSFSNTHIYCRKKTVTKKYFQVINLSAIKLSPFCGLSLTSTKLGIHSLQFSPAVKTRLFLLHLLFL